MSAELLSIGDVARRTGVAVSALRFYQDKGLIFAIRTAGQQRRFEPGTLRRIGVIRAAQSLGMTLGQVRSAFASLPDGRTPTQLDWEKLAKNWEGDIDARIERLQYLKRKLASCIQCGCLSIDTCALYNPDDVAASEGPGARGLPPLEAD